MPFLQQYTHGRRKETQKSQLKTKLSHNLRIMFYGTFPPVSPGGSSENGGGAESDTLARLIFQFVLRNVCIFKGGKPSRRNNARPRASVVEMLCFPSGTWYVQRYCVNVLFYISCSSSTGSLKAGYDTAKKSILHIHFFPLFHGKNNYSDTVVVLLNCET